MNNQATLDFMTQPWVEQPTQEVRTLSRFGLALSGDFTLASGAKSDLYLDLRSFRSSHEAIWWMTGLYAAAIRRLDACRTASGLKPIDVLAEVPAAMSPLVGALALVLGKRVLTVRKEAKAHGSGKEAIGDLQPDDEALVVDDVMTSGGSVELPIAYCRARGIEPVGAIVLVDRNGGWRDREGSTPTSFLGVPVWAGLSLAQVRATLGL